MEITRAEISGRAIYRAKRYRSYCIKLGVPMLIYKICDASLWDVAFQAGVFEGAEIDLTDGYIHFSTAEQMRETAAKHFVGREGLVIIAVDPEKLGDEMKWESSRGGALFPHLYRPLQVSETAWTEPLPFLDGAHVFPAKAV